MIWLKNTDEVIGRIRLRSTSGARHRSTASEGANFVRAARHGFLGPFAAGNFETDSAPRAWS